MLIVELDLLEVLVPVRHIERFSFLLLKRWRAREVHSQTLTLAFLLQVLLDFQDFVEDRLVLDFGEVRLNQVCVVALEWLLEIELDLDAINVFNCIIIDHIQLVWVNYDLKIFSELGLKYISIRIFTIGLYKSIELNYY